MNSPAPPFTLREILGETRAHLSRPTVFGTQAAVAIVLSLSGPFGTLEYLSLPARMAYWGGVVFVTYAMGTLLNRYTAARLGEGGGASIGAIAALSITTGAVASAIILTVNYLLFGSASLAPGIVLTTVGVSILVSGLIGILSAGKPTEPDAPEPPALLERLPLDKRGALVSLSVSDHYVDVVTVNGRDMLLMRLSDAIREVGDTKGLQVHRSHWVATGQINRVERRGEGAMLTMVSGDQIPVSRTNMAALREAGLLPSKGR